MGSLIRDGMWLGSLDDACNTAQLQKQGTTHILTVEFRPLSTNHQKDFEYKYVHAEDMPDQDLLSHFKECFEFIDEAFSTSAKREDGKGGVLVHCYVGFSRSATIVLAYLMRKEKLSYCDAYDSVRKLRSVGPNPGFLQQLYLFEKMHYEIDKDDPDFRAFCLSNITGKIRELSFIRSNESFDGEDVSGCALDNALAADPLCNPSNTPENLVFKCRKCRRPLAKGTSLISHSHGRGKAFPGTPPPQSFSKPLHEQEKEVECSLGIFIEPVEWMKEQILTLEGKISCPKCKAKIGTFSWVGQSCPCGRWIVPAFHVAQNKIDKDYNTPKQPSSPNAE